MCTGPANDEIDYQPPGGPELYRYFNGTNFDM